MFTDSKERRAISLPDISPAEATATPAIKEKAEITVAAACAVASLVYFASQVAAVEHGDFRWRQDTAIGRTAGTAFSATVDLLLEGGSFLSSPPDLSPGDIGIKNT